MKKLIAIVIFTLSSTMLMAQDNSFNNFYSKYADNPDFTKVAINKKMFEMIGELAMNGSPEDKEVMEVIRKLDGFKMLATDAVTGQKYFKDLQMQFNKGYEELMTVKDGDDDMVFMVKEKGDKIAELVMLINNKETFMAMSLYGDIDLKNIAKLAKKMNVEGLEYLENLDDQ